MQALADKLKKLRHDLVTPLRPKDCLLSGTDGLEVLDPKRSTRWPPKKVVRRVRKKSKRVSQRSKRLNAWRTKSRTFSKRHYVCLADAWEIEVATFLKARGDKPPSRKLNAKDTTYTADYLVKKSPLAPYFAHLGFTRGYEIHNAFNDIPDYRFYQMIYFMYALVRLNPNYLIHRFPGYASSHDIYGKHMLFKGNRTLTLYRVVKKDYYELRDTLKEEVADASTLTVKNSEEFMDCLKRRIDKPNLAARLEGYSKSAPDLVAFLVNGEFALSCVRDACSESGRTIAQTLACNAFAREALAQFYSTNVKLRGTIDENTQIYLWDTLGRVLGYTPYELERMADAYCEHRHQMLEQMAYFQPIDLTPWRCYADSCDAHIEKMTDSIEPDINTSGSLVTTAIPRSIIQLADRLAEKHGSITISREASGIHIYMCDPDLLRADGLKELASKHLALNAEKYLGIGVYDIDDYPTRENKELYKRYRMHDKEVPSAISMKTKKVYLVSDLLAYKPLHMRDGLKDVKPDVRINSINRRLVHDENGNLVPEWCGETTPLTQLPTNHPAVVYLTARGYDLDKLEKQFNCCYCSQALPESRSEGRYYSKLPGGVVNSPAGRIVFSAMMNGVRTGYQSRYIDLWSGDNHFFWTGSESWIHIATRQPDGTITPIHTATQAFPKGFAPHKYLNAAGCERNKLLMGFDAAIEFNKELPFNKRYCYLVEGPLDAAKLGAPAIALLGKSISEDQASEIRKNFSHVFTVMDNDAAGKQCFERIQKFITAIPIVSIDLPESVKDVGDLSYAEVATLVEPYVSNR